MQCTKYTADLGDHSGLAVGSLVDTRRLMAVHTRRSTLEGSPVRLSAPSDNLTNLAGTRINRHALNEQSRRFS